MRVVSILLAVLLATVAHAVPPDDAYLSARDAAFAAIKKGAGEAEQQRLRADLEAQLRRLVRPLRLKAFSGPSAMSPDTLSSDDVGFGGLDGIRFANADQSDSVLVTTDGLLRQWLAAHKDWWKDLANPPAEPEAAFRSEAFYTQAVSADAAVSIFSALPIRKPAGATVAVAHLVQQSQDLATEPPTEIAVAVIVGGEVFIALVTAEAKPAPITACDALWQDYKTKSEALHERYRASDLKDQASFDEAVKLENAGADALHKCWAEKASAEPAFPALTRQAQTLADMLAQR